MYLAGIDIGGTTVKCGLFDQKMNLLEKWEIPTVTEKGCDGMLVDIENAVKEKCRECSIAYDQIAAYGIGVPGAVTEDGIVNRCVNLGWGREDVGMKMKVQTGIDTYMANDANAAALGEYVKGAAAQYHSMVLLTLGTGVGGGVVCSGRLITGAFGAGGEVGHMLVNPEDKETCSCGRSGCLEQYASATGLVHQAKKILAEQTEASLLDGKTDFSAKDVFDAAKKDDAAALRAVDRLAFMLARAMADIACVVDPDVFLLGGGVSKAGPILTDVVKKYYRQMAFHASTETAIEIATLGNDAGMYGAAAIALEGARLSGKID
jgi:glucokinase